MKPMFRSQILCGLVGWAAAAWATDASPILYEVSFKDEAVATQTVSIVQSSGLTTVSAAFEADLPVFIAIHHYSEQLSVSFRADGTVERLGARIQDGPIEVVIAGALQADGSLRIVRTDRDGISTNQVARGDYDFHSLILYGTPPAQFLPAKSPARVLSIAQGRVVPISIQSIAESDTFELQNLASTHLVWTEGIHASHSWHPERFSNLPRRYVRQTENGEFTFTLLR